jgi:hypothetical protein
MKHGWPLALLLAVLALAACGDSAPTIDERVLDYCRYGSDSRARFKGCTEHVRLEDVRRRNTNAARYAKGELNVCLADAGPFCSPRRDSLLPSP